MMYGMDKKEKLSIYQFLELILENVSYVMIVYVMIVCMVWMDANMRSKSVWSILDLSSILIYQ